MEPTRAELNTMQTLNEVVGWVGISPEVTKLLFDHIGVAPVYVKGRQRFGSSDYLTLQLVTNCQTSLERLHTTFSILIDKDTPSLPDMGTYRQVKLYGGMRDLRRGQSDSLPIVLDNAKIIPTTDNVRWE